MGVKTGLRRAGLASFLVTASWLETSINCLLCGCDPVGAFPPHAPGSLMCSGGGYCFVFLPSIVMTPIAGRLFGGSAVRLEGRDLRWIFARARGSGSFIPSPCRFL